jgi:hypothetical protein
MSPNTRPDRVAKSSRTYRQKGGRLGADYTPWTLPVDLHHLLQSNWHFFTATEIAIAARGGWSEQDLVTLTARLCDHAITWDDRTLDPIPLHLATRMDLDHPDSAQTTRAACRRATWRGLPLSAVRPQPRT